MENLGLPFDAPARDVYTVSRLNREARILIERGLGFVWVQAEMSNLSRPSSGHWYFSLKDGDAQVRCAMFRQRNLLCLAKPRDGLLVLARVRVSLYEPRGEFQLVVEHLEEAGEGELRRQFELLKAKLQREGLFEAARKRSLPVLPRRIGIVTSPTGAALRDILNIARRRFPAVSVLIYPVPVQGGAAAGQIAAAIATASLRAECDVLIVARGGGSLEDLWAFNDERVARALAACRIPTVSGIGHEVDFTIADFVADVRAPTPSGAVEVALPDQREWLERLSVLRRRCAGAVLRRVGECSQKHDWLRGRLWQCHPGVVLAHQTQRLDDFEQRLRHLARGALERRAARLQAARRHLWQLSPATRLREIVSRRLH
ncbi:MAG TPA: exodeoxyribonuclease VII large subunit, partial [Burkholderiales bacterium]|nr:exodeoxyribonuclease VII large subunit [Burkholderiales bacterium]